jgi:hypothetical protein
MTLMTDLTAFASPVIGMTAAVCYRGKMRVDRMLLLCLQWILGGISTIQASGAGPETAGFDLKSREFLTCAPRVRRSLRFAEFFFCLLVALWVHQAHAQANERALITRMETSRGGVYEFSLNQELDTLLEHSADTDLYDPLTIARLRELQEDAEPPWKPDDVDPYKTRRVVEKAFAIQSARTISRVLQKSELAPAYRAFLRGVKSVQDFCRYSVQDTGEDITVAKETRGDKLLEFNMQFNLKQGVDPQIRVGDSFRLRWDYSASRTLFEYSLDF